MTWPVLSWHSMTSMILKWPQIPLWLCASCFFYLECSSLLPLIAIGLHDSWMHLKYVFYGIKGMKNACHACFAIISPLPLSASCVLHSQWAYFLQKHILYFRTESIHHYMYFWPCLLSCWVTLVSLWPSSCFQVWLSSPWSFTFCLFAILPPCKCPKHLLYSPFWRFKYYLSRDWIRYQ